MLPPLLKKRKFFPQKEKWGARKNFLQSRSFINKKRIFPKKAKKRGKEKGGEKNSEKNLIAYLWEIVVVVNIHLFFVEILFRIF